jgi:CRP/FNR family transcriptional regulator
MRDLCLPCGLGEADLSCMDELAFTRRRVKSGEHIFRAGDSFTSLYAVRSGFFRSSLTRSTGERQVTGFSMAGEVLGLDGIDDDQHTCDTMALEDSEICIIPFAQLERLSRELPALQRRMHRMMGREIMRDHGIMLLLGSMRAEERMATFLLNLSTRFAARGYSATAFHLRMSRDDIGSYLGVKLETVSRMLSRFQQEGLITVQHKDIEIRNLNGLKAVIGDYDKRRSPPSVHHVATDAA